MPEGVVVQGRVTLGENGHLSLIPAVPDGVIHFRTDCAVGMTGTQLPPMDHRVSAEGELSGRDLRVTRWSPLSRIPTDLSESTAAEGVAAEVAYAALDAVPKDWDVISTGAAKTLNGGRVAVLYVVRTTPAILDWTSRQAEGSVLVYAFIRKIGEPAILVGGESNETPDSLAGGAQKSAE